MPHKPIAVAYDEGVMLSKQKCRCTKCGYEFLSKSPTPSCKLCNSKRHVVFVCE